MAIMDEGAVWTMRRQMVDQAIAGLWYLYLPGRVSYHVLHPTVGCKADVR